MPSALSAPLTADLRQQTRGVLETRVLDMLVIGGGVVGAGAALDAATRGLSVAVIEAEDWANGTSSRSSKLVHGGIRYLEQLNFRLVHEALVERGRLLQSLAPHLVKPVAFLYPLSKRIVERGYVGAGMALYDVLGGRSRGVPRHRHLGARALTREMPGLRSNAFIGGLCYFDAQVDDARLVITLIRTAASHGAMAMSRARAVGIVQGAEGSEVTVLDQETGDTFIVQAKHVVNATGVWTAESEQAMGLPVGVSVTMSKGVHLLVDRDRIELDMGLLLRTEKSVLFVIPWGRHWILGTTDTPWHHDKTNPLATSADISYLLERVNAVLDKPLSRDDIVSVYSGLRPLAAGAASSTTKLSREHVIGVPRPGVAVIAGGKLTTYRVMAADVVDAVLQSTHTKTEPSHTEDVKLLGAEAFDTAAEEIRASLAARKADVSFAPRLVDRYGSVGTEVVALIDSDQSLAEPLTGAPDVLAAEVAYAVLAEDARHLQDVIVRRTRIAIEQPDGGVEAAPFVADVMSRLLGWSAADRDAELTAHQSFVELERDARALPSDASANALLGTRVPTSTLHSRTSRSSN